MKKLLLIFLLSIQLLFLQSCGQKESPKFDSKNDSNSLINFETEFESLKTRITDLELHKDFDEIIKNADTSVYLTIGAKGYYPIKTSIGFITISIVDIKPYASGSKIILDFGNPTSAGIEFKFKIDYGSLGANSLPEIKKFEKTKDVDVPSRLKAGHWNKVEIILDELPHNKLGYIRIHDLETKSIFMLTTP